jgi:hypothetical protein
MPVAKVAIIFIHKDLFTAATFILDSPKSDE